MQSKTNLSPKYITLIGAILAVAGFAYVRITQNPDVIAILFGFVLGSIMFLIGIAGLIGNWYKKRKSI